MESERHQNEQVERSKTLNPSISNLCQYYQINASFEILAGSVSIHDEQSGQFICNFSRVVTVNIYNV